ncbi:MAG: PIG-L family deacetylase [Fimbriimonadaceae bacterium]|nr:PIG-L family deacetylase [Fimbriimonadaceae bacterium]
MNVLMIGAHPDDCEIKSAGTAVLFRQLGHRVKYVSVTNGATGHQEQGGVTLARRRAAEAAAVAAVLGIEYQVLDILSGDLEATLPYRKQMIALIRAFEADLIFTHRPNDYHPDHRHTALLVQDSAYVVTVPSNVPLTPALPRNPVIGYFSDHFRRPYPFTPDIVLDITPVWDQKLRALHCHTSQMYEWLPYNSGQLDEVPADEAARLEWLRARRAPADAQRAEAHPELLAELYGPLASGVQYAEAFEVSEYGRSLTAANRRELFPMLPDPATWSTGAPA